MVYLIHFEKPYYRAQHYIGYTKDINARLIIHWKGNGSPLLKAVKKAGIKYSVVRMWGDADGNFERKLKKRKKARELCPICNPKSYMNNGVK